MAFVIALIEFSCLDTLLLLVLLCVKVVVSLVWCRHSDEVCEEVGHWMGSFFAEFSFEESQLRGLRSSCC